MAWQAMILPLLVIFARITGGNDTDNVHEPVVAPTSWKLLWLCPMPEPMPASYTVDRGSWSLVDGFSIRIGDEVLGYTARTLFSLSREMRLQTMSGDVWGVARIGLLSNHLDFFDCVGDSLVRFEAAWNWWGSTPGCDIIDFHGAVLGKTAVSTKLSSADTKVMAVEDADGHPTAQLIQRRSWLSVHTDVHILVQPDRMRANASLAMDPRVSPLDPLVDLRVLALYSAMRFGASALFLEGLIFDIIIILVACVVLRCCMVAYAHRRSDAEGSDLASVLEKKRDHALEALQQIEAELARERGGCAAHFRSKGDDGSWASACCRPAKLCDKNGYLQCATSM
mmetsp:Transcript_32835/g.83072  ORF Transcript_32835/g.83072 Transcript_32835/m.83072 type:complete len:339 (-) Transcript_32835:127-1143(-)